MWVQTRTQCGSMEGPPRLQMERPCRTHPGAPLQGPSRAQMERPCRAHPRPSAPASMQCKAQMERPCRAHPGPRGDADGYRSRPRSGRTLTSQPGPLPSRPGRKYVTQGTLAATAASQELKKFATVQQHLWKLVCHKVWGQQHMCRCINLSWM